MTPPSLRALARMLTLVVTASILVGCQSPRPLIILRDDAFDAWTRGDMVQAERDYVELVERVPAEGTARLQLARVYARQNEWEQALIHAEIARTNFPQLRDALEIAVRARVETGRTDTLADDLRANAITSGDWRDWQLLGDTLVAIGDLDAAEPALRAAATANLGQNLAPQLALARLYKQAGNHAAALRRYRMVLWLDPSSIEARQAIRDAGEIPGPTYAIIPEERTTLP